MMDTRNHLILVRKDFQNLAPLLGLMKVMKRANFTSQMALEKVVVQAFTGNNLKSKVKGELQGSQVIICMRGQERVKVTEKPYMLGSVVYPPGSDRACAWEKPITKLFVEWKVYRYVFIIWMWNSG
jgi:hypothetical protein